MGPVARMGHHYNVVVGSGYWPLAGFAKHFTTPFLPGRRHGGADNGATGASRLGVSSPTIPWRLSPNGMATKTEGLFCALARGLPVCPLKVARRLKGLVPADFNQP